MDFNFHGDVLAPMAWGNKSIFEEGFQHPHDPTFTTLKVAKEIEGYSKAPRSNKKCDTIYIGWKSPQKGWVKLNCDGSQNDRASLAGCGGPLRDSNGKWIKGYSRKIGSCDALHAEMWGMYLEWTLLGGKESLISMLRVILKCW